MKNITVKELIKRLEQCDENAYVILEGVAFEDFIVEIDLIVNDEDIFIQEFH